MKHVHFTRFTPRNPQETFDTHHQMDHRVKRGFIFALLEETGDYAYYAEWLGKLWYIHWQTDGDAVWVDMYIAYSDA